MFETILIANRGEIACRVIATAQRLGLRSIAVYSDADRDARHVRLADGAVHIGPAPARESYLRGERIIEAALRSGAQAIHPGYGFLSENAAFAEACAAAGLVFIGPPPAAIRAMGSKAEAKRLMEAAGVPLTPGYHGERQEPEFLAAQARQIGYPVLIKAVAGGGGKGMRRVDRDADFGDALASCRREAASAFGDDRVLIERYVQKPRHIEIQVFGDTQGNVVHLFERDCSVQRRHQKVLEEAPAPGMTPQRREAMGRAAVEAARAVGYVGAGTVEFIVEPSGAFFFMEMNTRLQVEHPVTELVTGLDLVEWQLRVAAGEPLPKTQQALALHGHAIEARLYAEDPARGFLPSTGRLRHLQLPAGVRVDSGVEAGDAITPYYDPMIAKLIVHGEDRSAALRRLRAALAAVEIVGVANNVGFLGRLAASRAFTAADLDTGLIEREQAQLLPPQEPVPARIWQLAALAELCREAQPAATPWLQRDGWRLNAPGRCELRFDCGEESQTLTVEYGAGAYVLEPEAARIEARASWQAPDRLTAQIAGERLSARVIADGTRRHLFWQGRHWDLSYRDTAQALAEGAAADAGLLAPMPGKVIAVLAEPGAALKKGAPLLVLEAMKMEHTITAPRDGRVKAFRYAAGDQVSDGAELLDFEADA